MPAYFPVESIKSLPIVVDSISYNHSNPETGQSFHELSGFTFAMSRNGEPCLLKVPCPVYCDASNGTLYEDKTLKREFRIQSFEGRDAKLSWESRDQEPSPYKWDSDYSSIRVEVKLIPEEDKGETVTSEEENEQGTAVYQQGSTNLDQPGAELSDAEFQRLVERMYAEPNDCPSGASQRN